MKCERGLFEQLYSRILIAITRHDGVKDGSDNSSLTKVKGREFNIPSTSIKTVLSSSYVMFALPSVLQIQYFVSLAQISHQPPYQLAVGTAYRHVIFKFCI